MFEERESVDSGIAALVDRAIREAGLEGPQLERLGMLGRALREQAPGLFFAAPRVTLLERVERGFFQPIDIAAMSEPQRALLGALLEGPIAHRRLRALLIRWIGHGDPREPFDRMRFDCMRMQEILRRGALRVFGVDLPHCDEILELVERLTLLQLAILAELARLPAPPRAREQGAPQPPSVIDRLRELIAAQRRLPGSSLAVLVAELGVIRRIDAVWGRVVGEAVRSRMLERLRNTALRAGDEISDFGRDDLIVLLPGIANAPQALLAARGMIHLLGAPIHVDNGEIRPRPAIGGAAFPAHGVTPVTLLRRAKLACQAAHASPDGAALYAASMEERQVNSQAYGARLRAALDADAFDLAFQPQFRVGTRALAGAETLLRWEDGELGEVEPRRLVAYAENAELITEVSWWVLDRAMRAWTGFSGRGLDVPVSVNLSPRNLLEPDLPDVVERGMRSWRVPPGRLGIEIAEGALLGDSAGVSEVLYRLRESGVRLSLDDFGTGYSSIDRLAALPLEEVKIARALVHDIDVNPQHERAVRSMIDLGHALGMTVVAQGVESAAVAERLAALECDRMQGYFPGLPLDAGEFASRYAG